MGAIFELMRCKALTEAARRPDGTVDAASLWASARLSVAEITEQLGPIYAHMGFRHNKPESELPSIERYLRNHLSNENFVIFDEGTKCIWLHRLSVEAQWDRQAIRLSGASFSPTHKSNFAYSFFLAATGGRVDALVFEYAEEVMRRRAWAHQSHRKLFHTVHGLPPYKAPKRVVDAASPTGRTLTIIPREM